MTTVEELQHAIRENEKQHQQLMESIQRQRETLQSVLEDQRQSFQELVARVTKLRVLKCEMLSTRPSDAVKDLKFDTGSKEIDEVLYTILGNLKEASLTGYNLLGKLYTAAQQAVPVQRSSKGSSLSSSSTATRQTDIAVIMRHDIRGVLPWAQKHCKKCPTCGRKRAQLPLWEQGEEKALGLAQVPDLRRIPQKCFYKASVRIVRQMCTGPMLDVVRVSTVLAVRCKDRSRMKDPVAVASRITEVTTYWVKKLLSVAKEEAKKAPWNTENTQNVSLAAAVEVLLHSLDVRVTVSVIPQTEVCGMDPECTPMKVYVVFLTPPYVPTLTPLLELLANDEQREYFMKYIIKPLAGGIDKLFGMMGVASKFICVGVNTLESFLRILQSEGLAGMPAKSSSKRSKGAPEEDILTKVYRILLSLAVFATSFEIDCSLPAPGDIGSVTSAKNVLLNVAESFLRLLTPLNPYTIPAVNDPKCANVILRLLRAPTTFLEILNSAFSSNKRLPSTSRVGVVDFLVSPKAKIRYGLKLFSEIVVDVYRPYVPNAGVAVADENSKGGKTKAMGCTPVTDMPRDIIRANVEVAEQGELYMKKIQECRRDQTIDTKVTENGEKIMKRVLMEAQDDTLLSAFMKDMKELQVEVVKTVGASVDIWLPFGIDTAGMTGNSCEHLYLHLDGHRQN